MQQLTAALKNTPSPTVDANSKPLITYMIPLSTGQGIQKQLWPRLTYHVVTCQQRDINIQGWQQQHQGRRRIEGWRHLQRCNPCQPKTTQTIISQFINACAPNRSQSNWNLKHWNNNCWPIVLDTKPPSKLWEFSQYWQRKVSILKNLLVYGAPQDLKNIQQCQY